MARTALSPIVLRGDQTPINFTPTLCVSGDAGSGNGFSVVNRGRTYILVFESGSNTPTVTVLGGTDPYNNTGNKTKVMAAGAFAVLGPYHPDAFTQTTEFANSLVVELTGTVTTLYIWAVTLP